jgi:F-type H+-transporting ATPase subunit b
MKLKISGRKVFASLQLLAVLFGLTLGAPVRAMYAQTGEATKPAAQSATAAKSEDEASGDEDKQYRESPMVTKLGAFVGMKPAQASTAFTITNLAILLAGVGYLLIKNLPKTFKGRSAGIQKQIVDARVATEEARTRLNSVEDRLSKLDEQIATMLNTAEADAVKEEQKIRAAIEDEKARILQSANTEIQSATLSARRELQKYAAELAVDQAAHKLVVTPEADRFLIEGFAGRLEALGKAEN